MADYIDRLISEADHRDLNPNEVSDLISEIIQLRARVKRPKVDPTQQVIVYTGNHTPTHSLTIIEPSTEQEQP